MVREEAPGAERLEERILSAFLESYPDVNPERAEHIARNFTQIIRGIVDIGDKVGNSPHPTHMDVANGLVYWCVSSAYTDSFEKGESEHDPEGRENSRFSDEEMQKLMGECSARIADWLIGLEVLRSDPELYSRFVAGAVSLGAADWERDRGKLKY